MKLVNLCCGANRVVDDTWLNLDCLHQTLIPGTPERANLDRESNYREHCIGQSGMLPLGSDEFDGVLASHCLEHWDCQKGVAVMAECRRILRPGGVLLVSVPDAATFRRHHAEDTAENAVRLFGEPIHLPDGETTFAGYALWNRWHRAILSEDALWAYFVRAGFANPMRINNEWCSATSCFPEEGPLCAMSRLLNRLPFSLIMMGTKS